MSKLTEKQLMFCKEYLIDLNGTQSAIRAGYSEKTANVTSSEYLAKPNIQAKIQELMAIRSEKVQITSDDVLRRLKYWLESDITEILCLSPEGIKELPKEFRQLITKIKHTKTSFDGVETEMIEATFVSKEKAMDWICRHIGFFEKDNKQSEVKVVSFDFVPLNKEDLE